MFKTLMQRFIIGIILTASGSFKIIPFVIHTLCYLVARSDNWVASCNNVVKTFSKLLINIVLENILMFSKALLKQGL